MDRMTAECRTEFTEWLGGIWPTWYRDTSVSARGETGPTMRQHQTRYDQLRQGFLAGWDGRQRYVKRRAEAAANKIIEQG